MDHLPVHGRPFEPDHLHTDDLPATPARDHEGDLR
jgi:hypothetical protein